MMRTLHLLLGVSLFGACGGRTVFDVPTPGDEDSSTGSAGSSALGGAGGTGRVGAAGGHVASGGSAGSATGGTGAGAQGGASGSSTGGTGVLPPATERYARGVVIEHVEANQAVAVRLVEAGEVLPVAERNAELIEARPLLFRVFVKVGEGWQPREIEARLMLSYGDGSNEEVSNAMVIKGDSVPDDLDSSLNFTLDPEQVRPDTSYSVELLESVPRDSPTPDPLPRVPGETGNVTELGVPEGRYTLNVVVVPALTPGGYPESTPERLQNLENHLMDLFPVSRVALELREPVPVESTTTVSSFFAALHQACEADDPGVETFYHMVARHDDTTFSFPGVHSGEFIPHGTCHALGLTLVQNEPESSTAYIDGNMSTLAHLLGHNHGRRNVDCGNPPDHPDPQFPYEDGFLGVQGFSLSAGALRKTSEYRDLMGHCEPRWVSDWQFMGLLSKTREIHPWSVQER